MPAIDKQDEIAILRHLSEIGESLTRPTILLPTDDEAAIFAAEHADRFAPLFCVSASGARTAKSHREQARSQRTLYPAWHPDT
jgi:hypothetical protein